MNARIFESGMEIARVVFIIYPPILTRLKYSCDSNCLNLIMCINHSHLHFCYPCSMWISASDLVTKGGTAMIRMYMDRDSLIKGCQIFADRYLPLIMTFLSNYSRCCLKTKWQPQDLSSFFGGKCSYMMKGRVGQGSSNIFQHM